MGGTPMLSGHCYGLSMEAFAIGWMLAWTLPPSAHGYPILLPSRTRASTCRAWAASAKAQFAKRRHYCRIQAARQQVPADG